MLQKFTKSKYYIAFLFLILLLIFIAMGREAYRYYRVSREIRDLKQKIEDLKKSNEELMLIKEYFTSKEFLEDEARKKLNMTKEGESVIVISNEGVAEEEIGAEEEKSKTSNIKLWWQYFFRE
jgi:cell division protein FtsB